MIKDAPDQLVLRVRSGEDSVEWIVLNSQGAELEVSPDPQVGSFFLTDLCTDSTAAYLAFQGENICCAVAIDATFLSVNGEDVFGGQERQTFEKQ